MNWLIVLVGLFVACTNTPPDEPTVHATARSTTVEGEGLERMSVLNADGLVIETRRSEPPTTRLQVGIGWADGARTVTVESADARYSLAIDPPLTPGPLELRIDAPVGQGSEPAFHGSTHAFSLVEGAQAQVALVAEVIEGGDYIVRLGGEEQEFENVRPGTRLNMMAPVTQDTELVIVGPTPDRETRSAIRVHAVTADELRDSLRFIDAPFPVNAKGEAEIDRPTNRITLPAGWWKTLLARTALGTRNWDRFSPWGYQGVTLQNPSDTAVNVAIRSVVTRPDGTPDPVFRPRFRDVGNAMTDTSALLRIPAKSDATAILPVYVDDDLLGSNTPPDGWLRRIEVTPLGIDTPLLVVNQPLYVSQASALISGTLFAALGGAAIGLLVIGFRWRTWLSDRSTTSLMVIAMLGAMMFTVSAGSQLIGMGIAALLGPFSSLLTGLVDDAFRTALMMTLLTLQPRPGTAALAILVQSLLGALTLGHFGPSQLLIIGNSVLWTELFLWVTGVTRTTHWIRGAGLGMWARVAFALAMANLTTGAFGLVLAAVLYRFYYAEWYVAMILIGPSFGYVLLGCAIALPFARSLREVSP